MRRKRTLQSRTNGPKLPLALPPLPEDCRALSRAGVQAGDRLDIALLKIDRALTRQNTRTTRCAEWFDQLRAGLQAKPSEGAE